MDYQLIWTEESNPLPLGTYFSANSDYEAAILINNHIGSGRSLENLKKMFVGKSLVKQMFLTMMNEPGRRFSEILSLRNRTTGETIISLVPKCNIISWESPAAVC